MKKALNILLGVLLVVTVALVGYAVVSDHSGVEDPSINLNLCWGYLLFALAVGSALFCAVWGMIQNPATIKSSLLSLVLVAAVVIVAYVVASGHDYKIVDIANNGHFAEGDTLIADTSVLVTYVAMVVAFVSAIVTEVWNALK